MAGSVSPCDMDRRLSTSSALSLALSINLLSVSLGGVWLRFTSFRLVFEALASYATSSDCPSSRLAIVN